MAYADAVGNVEIAKFRLEQAEKLAEQKAVGAEEVAIGRINLTTAQRKFTVLRAIAESALASAEKERKAGGDGDTLTQSRAAELESRMNILKAILNGA